MLGIWMGVFFTCVDIALHLSTIGAPQTDDSSDFAAIYEGDVIQDPSLRCDCQDPVLTVALPVVNPEQGVIPVQRGGNGKRQPVLLDVQAVLGRIEFKSDALV
jgi:hypothetical protein